MNSRHACRRPTPCTRQTTHVRGGGPRGKRVWVDPSHLYTMDPSMYLKTASCAASLAASPAQQPAIAFSTLDRMRNKHMLCEVELSSVNNRRMSWRHCHIDNLVVAYGGGGGGGASDSGEIPLTLPRGWSPPLEDLPRRGTSPRFCDCCTSPGQPQRLR